MYGISIGKARLFLEVRYSSEREQEDYKCSSRSAARYYNASIVKSAELGPSKGPYLFTVHPHGVLALGTSLTLSSDGASFSEHFPGSHQQTIVCYRSVEP
jgi:hypothetical protein